jgi:exodeoxyribonuclease VII large subunit
VQDKRMELIHVQQRLGDLGGVLLSRKRQRFGELAAGLDAMSPLKVLGRGYAMAQSGDGSILKSYRDVTAGDRISVTLGEGGFTAAVEEVHQ